MRDVVYLPAYHPMPAAAIARLAEVVNAVELEAQRTPYTDVSSRYCSRSYAARSTDLWLHSAAR